ncbi:LPXTG cell wall anchor domain-containing protein [Limosilactobacillus mucosae]|uniref:LPXTG cell wall anchor domain-containing protein n=1 Tax=Limosilactobacillus mucosae TaxID=97478 RepID=UPI0022E203F4|nr:LPXTG cell wall anchor domain-containing protein [Limosilactobacillus mucosae]
MSASAVPTTPSAPATSASSAKKSFVSGLLPQTGQAKSLLWILLGVVIVAGVAIKLYLDKKKK